MNGTLKKIIVGAIITAFLGISGWCLHQVSTIPAVYATKFEVKEVKSDIKNSLNEMKKDFNMRQDSLEKIFHQKTDIIIQHLLKGKTPCTSADTSKSMN